MPHCMIILHMAKLCLVELSISQGLKDELDNLTKSHKFLERRLKASEDALAKERDEISRISEVINTFKFKR